MKIQIGEGDIHPSLHGLRPVDLLPAAPLDTVIARHTIGLADPLTTAEISPDELLHDGLPQGLDDCIQTYGLSHFKIKVNGERERDFDRLSRVASVLKQHAPADYAFALDGNEQFLSAADFCAYWQALSNRRELRELFQRLRFVEQPLHRDVALRPEVGGIFQAWTERPPIIIDESDATFTSLPEALQLGYAGTSHKNCKGVFKGIANACLLAHRRRLEPEKPWLMSGEDLCNQGPIALLQDLAVMAALGIRSVERNGHHYVAGLASSPPAVQQQILRSHDDLYHASPAGWPTVRIAEGQLGIASLNATPFGVRFVLDPGQFTPRSQWRAARP